MTKIIYDEHLNCTEDIPEEFDEPEEPEFNPSRCPFCWSTATLLKAGGDTIRTYKCLDCNNYFNFDMRDFEGRY